MAKTIMLGNQAVARGLYEAGCVLVSSYPGTPSTEITEFAAKYDEIYAEWAPNEKVALEVALGGAVAGGRTFCAMKHVGLNVAADPLFITAYTGINGGMIIAVADDPGMHSSQNEQDSRHYAAAAKLPMIEPADSAECLEFIKMAYNFSEKYDTPFVLRLSTRVSHSQSIVDTSDRVEQPLKEYIKDAQKYVMMPAAAKKRHVVVEQRLNDMVAWADEGCPFNKIEYNSKKLGIVTSGISYNYAKEVFGDDASYFKLGMVYPMPEKALIEFASQVERVIVIEELDDIFETQLKKLGIRCDGKNLLPKISEFSHELLREKLLDIKADFIKLDAELPNRPPVMCPGCPHRGLFYTLKKMKLTVTGDIGCYTLGAVPPLGAIDTTFCMGASVSALHGFDKVRNNPKNTVAVIGDSTFMHSGITGLCNITYNQGISTVLILDNSITGMTGHQQNPTTGYTLKNQPVKPISIEKICEGAGIDPEHIRICDPADPKELEKVIREEIDSNAPSVVIVRRPCALLKQVAKDTYYTINSEKCRACRACMAIACPAISMIGTNKPSIDTSLCIGCGLCKNMCRFDSITQVKR